MVWLQPEHQELLRNRAPPNFRADTPPPQTRLLVSEMLVRSAECVWGVGWGLKVSPEERSYMKGGAVRCRWGVLVMHPARSPTPACVRLRWSSSRRWGQRGWASRLQTHHNHKVCSSVQHQVKAHKNEGMKQWVAAATHKTEKLRNIIFQSWNIWTC